MASNKRVNKAYVRYDGTGRVISGSLILNRFKPKVGNWSEIPAYECCNPSPIPVQSLRLLFSNIEEIGTIVGDVNSVTDWNTFFDLPTNGNLFTSVEVTGSTISLYGGTNITLYDSIFYGVESLISVEDTANNCIVSSEDYVFEQCYNLKSVTLSSLLTAGYDMFYDCTSLTDVSFPVATDIQNYCFEYCESITNINIPACITLGNSVDQDNGVFNGISGNTITLTVPSALMTCNGGLPDGDIEILQANNTVTIITV